MFSTPIRLVIPCYNERDRFTPEAFAAALSQFPKLGFCFVDDGSRDGTHEVLTAFQSDFPERVSVQRLADNVGKGEAVRHGVLHVLDNADARIVGYWDADLAAPLGQLVEFEREAAMHSKWSALLGSRHKRLGTEIRRSEFRHYVGRVFATFASMLLHLPVYDTQCGAKLFRSEVATRVFATPFCSRWCFDVEILARLLQSYGNDRVLSEVVEVPLREWAEVGQSKLRPMDLPRMAVDLLRIRKKYGLSGQFSRSVE